MESILCVRIIIEGNMSKKIPFATMLCFAGSFLSAETHRISPDRYYTTFSATHPAIAHIRPGDTVVTKCLDSRGRDDRCRDGARA